MLFRSGLATHLPAWHQTLLPQLVWSATGGCWQPPGAAHRSVVQALPSLQLAGVPAHTLLLQKSFDVHTLPSLQALMLGTLTQPLALSQLSSVQGLPSSHEPSLPGTHLPLLHWSPVVQTLPSSQGAVLLADLQPVAASQLSTVQGLPSSHRSAGPGWHWPSLQTSLLVQALPSEQLLPLFTVTQPLLASQMSVVHGLPSSQFTDLPALQLPPAQASPIVHGLPSSQGRLLPVCTQPLLGLQLSVVHGLPSSQSTAVPGLQAPSAHWSPLVQALLSVQAAVFLANTQPEVASQLSSVQTLPSWQLSLPPPVQAPALQASPPVQAVPSLHTVPFNFGL